MDYNKKAKYRLVASETLEDLIEMINYLAESGYELDKLTTSGTANNDWQGIAVMKLANEQTHTKHSDKHEQKTLHIADVSNSLVAFMLWYKKNVPIGTQKSSEEIVSDYLSNL